MKSKISRTISNDNLGDKHGDSLFFRANRHLSGAFGGMKMEKNDGRQLLPVARIKGQEFLVDVENRQFRNFNEPDEVIGMHSQQGRQMVKEMQGSDWKSYGLSTGAEV